MYLSISSKLLLRMRRKISKDYSRTHSISFSLNIFFFTLISSRNQAIFVTILNILQLTF